MSNVRILFAFFSFVLLAACERAPFDLRMVSACGEDNRPGHATLMNADGDGVPDIAVTCITGSSGGSLRVYRTAAAGGLEEIAHLEFDESALAAVPLAPEEGKPEGLLVSLTGSHERWVVHVPNNDGSFGEPETVFTSRYEVGRMVLSDINGDGVRDIVMPRLDVWLENEGSHETPGPFRRQRLERNSRGQRVSGDVANLNGDSRDDGSYLVKADGVIRTYTAAGRQDIVLGDAIDEVGAVLGGGDFNDDGRNDLVVSAIGMPEDKVVMLALSGDDGTWSLSDPIQGIHNPATVLARDFDGDGNLDILAAPKAQSDVDDYSLTYLAGMDAGGFGKPLSIATPAFPYRMLGGSAAGPADVVFLDGLENRLGFLDVKPE